MGTVTPAWNRRRPTPLWLSFLLAVAALAIVLLQIAAWLVLFALVLHIARAGSAGSAEPIKGPRSVLTGEWLPSPRPRSFDELEGGSISPLRHPRSTAHPDFGAAGAFPTRNGSF